jgi:hypothetical protein
MQRSRSLTTQAHPRLPCGSRRHVVQEATFAKQSASKLYQESSLSGSLPSNCSSPPINSNTSSGHLASYGSSTRSCCNPQQHFHVPENCGFIFKFNQTFSPSIPVDQAHPLCSPGNSCWGRHSPFLIMLTRRSILELFQKNSQPFHQMILHSRSCPCCTLSCSGLLEMWSDSLNEQQTLLIWLEEMFAICNPSLIVPTLPGMQRVVL